MTSEYRKSRGPSPGGTADRSGCGLFFLFFPFTGPINVFMADYRCGGKRGRVITALTTVAGLPRKKKKSSFKKKNKKIIVMMARSGPTCPGKTPETGVEPPEWVGEFGRDLQEASRAACFLAIIIF